MTLNRLHVVVLAIAAVVGLEVLAISHGIDGKVLTFSIGSITALGGYGFGFGHRMKQ